MNRINKLFATKSEKILSIYFCAGHPTLEGTVETIKTLEKKGVDMIEVGIPFSDPMADGPVIQDAATNTTGRTGQKPPPNLPQRGGKPSGQHIISPK